MCHLSSFGQNGFNQFSLKCKVRVQFTFLTDKEINSAELIVNISEDKDSKYKFIRIKSANEDANDISVSTAAVGITKDSRISVSDRSDENTYDLTNIENFMGRNSMNRIYLNRNNGEIIVSREFTSPRGVSQTSIGGTCEKIDKTKKKF